MTDKAASNLTIFGVLFIAAGIIFLALGDSSLVIFGVLELVGGIGCAIAVIRYKVECRQKQLEAKWQESMAQERQRQAEEKEKQEQARKEAICEKGEWLISSIDFYNRCCQSNVKEINSDFTLQKAVTIAGLMFNDAGVPKQFYPTFLEEQKLKAFFNEGKQEAQRRAAIAEEMRRKAEEKRRTTPVAGKLSEQEAAQVHFSASLIHLTGKDKRRKILEDELDSINSQIQPLRQEISRLLDQHSNRYVNAAMVYAAAPQEKTHDWATAGGIAEGIAGPAAGLAVALDTMNENAKIEARNAQTKQVYTTAANNILQRDYFGEGRNVGKKITSLENRAKPLQEALDALEEKVVLNGIDKSVLSKYLKVTYCNVEKRNSNILYVTVSLRNNYTADVPDGVTIVVDGTLSANIYCGDILVGSAIAAFPTFGIACGDTVTVTALCNRYLEGNRKYRAEITFNKLWVMEK